MQKVFVTRRIPEPGLEMLRARCQVEVNPEDRVLSKEEIIEGIQGKDALLCLLTDEIDEEIMDANPNLQVISNYAVGFNNIKVAEATRRGLPITNTPGVLTETTADMAWTLLMAAGRRLVEADKFTRAGKYKGWGPMLLLGYDIYGKTLGLVGLGRIGEAMVKRGHGFGMKILYFDANRRSPEEEKALGIEYRQLDQLLAEADYVSLHVPLLSSTHHLISQREFGLMKESAVLINSARGPIVDEKALATALKEGQIAAAGLDVYENEPAVEPELLGLDNVILAPHIASATRETRTKMATMAAENLLAVLDGKVPPNIVNPEVFNK